MRHKWETMDGAEFGTSCVGGLGAEKTVWPHSAISRIGFCLPMLEDYRRQEFGLV